MVIVERNAGDACRAFSMWLGHPIGFATMQANLKTFQRLIRADVMTVAYADLDSYSTVASIVGHCTGRSLPGELWQTFDLLKIEQHMPKARMRCLARHQ